MANLSAAIETLAKTLLAQIAPMSPAVNYDEAIIVPDDIHIYPTLNSGQIRETDFFKELADRLWDQFPTDLPSIIRRERVVPEIVRTLQGARICTVGDQGSVDAYLRRALDLPLNQSLPNGIETIYSAFLDRTQRFGNLPPKVQELLDQNIGVAGDDIPPDTPPLNDQQIKAIIAGISADCLPADHIFPDIDTLRPDGDLKSTLLIGRVAHLVIQQDYIADHRNHIVVCEAWEFGSGMPIKISAGNRTSQLFANLVGFSRVDIWDQTTGEMYEIKPRAQAMAGLPQLWAKYLCPLLRLLNTSSQPGVMLPHPGVGWRPLNRYTVTLGELTYVITAEFETPGLIVYDVREGKSILKLPEIVPDVVPQGDYKVVFDVLLELVSVILDAFSGSPVFGSLNESERPSWAAAQSVFIDSANGLLNACTVAAGDATEEG